MRCLLAAIVLIPLGLVGCAKNKQAPATVSGKITYNGQPLKAGSIKFVTPTGTAYDGQISTDGTYSALDLPEGEMVITVDTEGINPANKPSGKEAAKRANMMQKPPEGSGATTAPTQYYVKIPSKYSNAKTSPLTVKLSSGRQVKDVELVD